MSAEETFHLLLAGATVGVALAFVLRRKRTEGTTLTAPLRWTLFALLLVCSSLLLETFADLGSSAEFAIRYLASTSTLCPLMAILGAKRPQNKGWQFIVITLWLVLILPVVEMLFLWRGGAVDVGKIRSWFLLILVLVGFTNYALTRHLAAAALASVAQGLLLLPHLPGRVSWEPHFTWGCVLLVGASLMLLWSTQTSRTNGGWELVWTEFRSAFGLVWGLRVMERVNEAARLGKWNCELTWFGFTGNTATENEAPTDAERDGLGNGLADGLHHKEIERTMRTTLRRFVSPEWIEKKHGGQEPS